MVPQALLVPLPADIPLLFAFITAIGIIIVILFCIVVVCLIATSFIAIVISLICNRFFGHFFERSERDIELGRVTHDDDYDNNQAMEIYDDHGLQNNIEERKALRQQALEKLLPPFVFGSKKALFTSCEDCSICLEDYNDGDLCRVFPVCNHMFHLKCIDPWLKKQLTCPICRKCLLDA
ncbi:hypothetical protein ACOSQ3_031298 [Xanthoceras sorbifolium]